MGNRSVVLLSEGMAPSKTKKKDGFPSMRLGHDEAERERQEAGRVGKRVSHWAAWTISCARLVPEVTFRGMGRGS